jgi:hypothetical protein
MGGGGVEAPVNPDAAEEFEPNAPRNEEFPPEEEDPATVRAELKAMNEAKSSGSSNNKSDKSDKSGSSSSNSKSAGGVNRNDEFKSGHSKVDLADVSRGEAKRHGNMNEEDVEHAGTPNSEDDKERSSQRAPRDAGPKEDIEMLHGQAELGDNDKSKQSKGGSGSGSGSGNSGKGGNGQSGKQGHSGKGHPGEEEDPMRHNAEKFVKLDDE